MLSSLRNVVVKTTTAMPLSARRQMVMGQSLSTPAMSSSSLSSPFRASSGSSRHHSNTTSTSKSTSPFKLSATADTTQQLQQQQQRRQQQDATNNNNSTSPQFHPVYVHHVSRVALEYLQSNARCSDWLIHKGLDRGLSIHPNGTFTLTFPSSSSDSDVVDDDKVVTGTTTTNTGPHGFGKIWTSYDPKRKQHWLSVYRRKLAVRFLLKDHNNHHHNHHQQGSTSTTTTTANSTAMYRTGVQQITSAVDEMIKAVDQVDWENINNEQRRNIRRQRDAQQSTDLFQKLSQAAASAKQ